MNLTGIKRFVSGAVATLMCISAVHVGTLMKANGAASVGETLTLYGSGQYKDVCDGYSYEIWQEDTPNTSSMTLGSGGSFSTQWQCGPDGSRGNFLARRGLSFGLNNSKHWQDYGNFTCDFDCDWQPGNSGNSRICIYGWTQNPLVEYYIIEDWKNWVPKANGAPLAQVTIDGSLYDIFTDERDSYTIEGNKHFTQYFSVRHDTRSKGTISIYKHFEAWEKVGLKMGGLYEVAFNVEGWESDGKANVKKNVITAGGDIPTEAPTEPPTANENGDYLTENFESGVGDFTGRGTAEVAADSKNYYDGSKSLKVTGRTDNWHGGQIALSSSTFIPGQTYSISAAGLQKSGEATSLKLTLEYTAGGTQDWKDIASATANSGEWTKLENTEFEIPSGASGMSLYIEAPESLTDVWLDAVQISEKGKASSVKTGGGTVEGSTVVTTTEAPTEPVTTTPANVAWGDANEDGDVSVADPTFIMQVIAGKSGAKFTDLGNINADVSDNGDGVTSADALVIQKFLAGTIKQLPASYSKKAAQTTTKAVQTTVQTTVTTTKASVGGVDTSWIDPSKPMVAISFDDGAVGSSPSSSSMRIINALAGSGFHSTFFYVGDWTNGSDDENEIKYAYSKGMEIANHTTTHPKLTEKTPQEIRYEYDTTQAKLKNIIGADPSPLMRLPFLDCDSKVSSTLNDVALISCKIDTGDWNYATKDDIIAKVVNAMNDGSLRNSIVLCHETYDTTAEAMEYLAPYLKSQGWQIVTISEMFAVNGKQLQGGNVYTACY